MSAALTQEIVRELLDYDPLIGLLTWRRRDRRWFTSDRICNSWNAKHVGKAAFTAHDTYGHAHGSIFGKLHLAHRVVWLWMTGCWPCLEIDHRNHKRDDNRWANLEEVTGAENIARRRRSGPKIDTSGNAGVHREWRTKEPSYVAVIGGKHLGTYRTVEAARVARRAAELKLAA